MQDCTVPEAPVRQVLRLQRLPQEHQADYQLVVAEKDIQDLLQVKKKKGGGHLIDLEEICESEFSKKNSS